MVSGSVATGFYATQRCTKDIDILIELAMEDAHRLQKLLQMTFIATYLLL